MVKVLLDIDDEENKIVRVVMAHKNITDKKIAIKTIIRAFGKRIKKQLDGELGEL